MMEMTIPSIANTRLSTFNNLTKRYQDDAYTLAYYFLGDESRAAEATQAAFTRLYERASLSLNQFRLEILHWVLSACHTGAGRLARGKVRDELVGQLLGLKEDERSVLVLVDVLGLNYAEAAQVLGCSQKQASRLLAQARIKLNKTPLSRNH